MLSKQQLREQIMAARDRLSTEQRADKSRAIRERLLALPQFQDADTVMMFSTYGSEVQTIPLIERALSVGKRVVLPKIEAEQRRLRPFVVRDLAADTEPGVWGIRQPLPERCDELPLAELELIVTPGVGFDERCNRLGHGKAYYDRFLLAARTAQPDVRAVAVAFEVQVVPELPTEPHDEKVDAIHTEARVILPERVCLPTQ
ncbi:MAG: 5-formyltetrahydrofolate cyclo-ligase [Armatimonadota bacterium]